MDNDSEFLSPDEEMYFKAGLKVKVGDMKKEVGPHIVLGSMIDEHPSKTAEEFILHLWSVRVSRDIERLLKEQGIPEQFSHHANDVWLVQKGGVEMSATSDVLNQYQMHFFRALASLMKKGESSAAKEEREQLAWRYRSYFAGTATDARRRNLIGFEVASEDARRTWEELEKEDGKRANRIEDIRDLHLDGVQEAYCEVRIYIKPRLLRSILARPNAAHQLEAQLRAVQEVSGKFDDAIEVARSLMDEMSQIILDLTLEKPLPPIDADFVGMYERAGLRSDDPDVMNVLMKIRDAEYRLTAKWRSIQKAFIIFG